MLGALDLQLVLPHVALGERVVGVAAAVAEGVHVVADPHQRDAVRPDVDPASRSRLDVVQAAGPFEAVDLIEGRLALSLAGDHAKLIPLTPKSAD